MPKLGNWCAKLPYIIALSLGGGGKLARNFRGEVVADSGFGGEARPVGDGGADIVQRGAGASGLESGGMAAQTGSPSNG